MRQPRDRHPAARRQRQETGHGRAGRAGHRLLLQRPVEKNRAGSLPVPQGHFRLRPAARPAPSMWPAAAWSTPSATKLSLTAEGRPAAGNAAAKNARRGLGGYFHLDRKSGWRFPLPAQLTLGGIYLSGDDPATPRYEGWDAAFSRWPKWSDSLIYLQARETRVADWTNFISLYGQPAVRARGKGQTEPGLAPSGRRRENRRPPPCSAAAAKAAASCSSPRSPTTSARTWPAA